MYSVVTEGVEVVEEIISTQLGANRMLYGQIRDLTEIRNGRGGGAIENQTEFLTGLVT